MDAATYWRLRFLQAESEKAALVAAQQEQRYRDALQAVGIDPQVPHQWDDERTTLIPAAPGDQAPK
jgi:hypothetical protein